MEEYIYKTALAILIVAFFLIRAPSVRKASKTEKSEEKKPARERFMVLLNFIGMVGIPFVYILTSWLDVFAFSLPEIIRLFGIGFNIVGLVFLAWIHRALGQHWSMMLKLGEGHKLVTTGPYARIRHPMYTFFYILVISTALISANIPTKRFALMRAVEISSWEYLALEHGLFSILSELEMKRKCFSRSLEKSTKSTWRERDDFYPNCDEESESRISDILNSRKIGRVCYGTQGNG